MASYFDAFSPAPAWDELVGWPPDVFALANLVLDHTAGYRFVVDPPGRRRWPPLPDWDGQILAAARGWRVSSGHRGVAPPRLVLRSWETVTRFRHAPLAEVRSGDAWHLWKALMTLHSIADEACAAVARPSHASHSSFESAAWRLLQARGSLSRLSPTRVRIVPKTHFSPRGITIRSLSRYLALCYEAVDVRWCSVDADEHQDSRDRQIVLFPWPLSVNPGDFRPVRPTPLENMDPGRFGFFEFVPEPSLDCGLVDAVLEDALDQTDLVDAVVFPESAVHSEELHALEQTVERHGVPLLVAGVRRPPEDACFGRNYLHFGIRTAGAWHRCEQDKNHRWCLDEDQIRRYHLTRLLDPKKLWWEAIGMQERRLHVIDIGGGVTTTPLVCEDLASLDEVADMIRRIGPSLVIAVLLDGPQLRSRWSCRYGSVLVGEPGSAVLTLTSAGMVALSRARGTPASREVALWNSCSDGVHEISLAPRASAILLSVRPEPLTRWTADGRCHSNVPGLTLSDVRQLHASRTRSRRLALR